MASVVGNLRVLLSADTAEFSRNIKQAERNLLASADKMARVGSQLTRGVTLPLAAIGAASVKLASDAAESADKFAVVFGSAAGEMTDFIRDVQEILPATRAELQDMTSGLQDLLVPMGVIPREAVKMNQSFVRLAGDLASLNNLRITDVLNDLRSGIVGQSEPLLKYGIDVRAAAVKTKALELGLISAGQEMTNAARAAAVLAIATEQSTFAIGNAEDTAGSAANQFKFLVRDVKELSTEIGNVLLPIVVSLVRRINDVLRSLRDVDPMVLKVAVGIGALAAAIGPLLIAAGALVRAIVVLRGATALGGLAALVAPGGGLIIGLTALAGLFLTIRNNARALTDSTKTVVGELQQLGASAATATAEAARSQLTQNAIVAEALRQQVATAQAEVDRLRERSERIRGALATGGIRVPEGFAGGAKLDAAIGQLNNLKARYEEAARNVELFKARLVELHGAATAETNPALQALQAELDQARAALESATTGTDGLATATRDLNMAVFELHPNLERYAEEMAALDRLERDNLRTKVDTTKAAEMLADMLKKIKTDFAREELEKLREKMFDIQIAAHQMSSSVGNAIEELIFGTKSLAEAFRDMVEEILRALVRLAIQRLIVQPLFDILTGALGGGAKIPGLAAGGPVQAGRAFLVGEQGPELFVPGRSGAIVPNHQLGGGGPSVVQHFPIHVNIHAWDSRDVSRWLDAGGGARMIHGRLANMSATSLVAARKLTGGR